MTDDHCCIDPENGGANTLRDEVLQSTHRANFLQAALVALAGLAVIVASSTAVVVGLGNRSRTAANQKEIAKRQAETEKATAAAVQVILDYIDDVMGPHRLRNEAENKCQAELFAGDPPYARKGVSAALAFYDECVLRRSGNTAPPPLPPNPLTTTTTTR